MKGSSRKPLRPPADAQRLRTRMGDACTRDVGRLLGCWQRLARDAGVGAVCWQKLEDDIEASVARRSARAATKPVLRLDAALPVSARGDDIVALIQKHQVVVIAGETGSGKTTQLPKLCLAAGRGEAGLIGCTQPRRLAARSMARRVAEELGTHVGEQVGFQVRFSEQVSERTLVKFMTDGILLAQTQSDPWLSAYDTLIIDEAHERSLNIDFLLGYLKRLAERRSDLKIIVTSATIDTARFAEHFDHAPVIEVEGRAYPVELRWRPTCADAGFQQGGAEHIAKAVDDISAEDPRADVLVFLPGEREIRDAHRVLSRRQYRHTEILPLYARLSARDQDRVFKPGPLRRVVLATNVAETSLTVPRIRCVIDPGNARVKRYSQRSQIERLHIEPISQAAADQRKGRCGRIGPGICIRLYDEADFASRPRFTDPELLRSSLANVILRMLSLKLGAVENFPFLDVPEPRAIADGYRRLAELSAIDDARHLTTIGNELACLPIDVQLARMLVEAQRLDVVPDLLVIVAFLSVQDPRERPADARSQADAAHREFADPKSDFVGMLKLWRAYAQAHDDLTQSKLRDWCARHFLSFMRMREWRELHRQLKLGVKPGPGTRDPGPAKASPSAGRNRDDDSVPSAGLRKSKARLSANSPAAAHARIAADSPASGPGSRVPGPDANYEAIHLSLLSGLPTQVARRDENGAFKGTRERKFQVFPGSALAKKPPTWLLAAQILDLSGKVWAMQCAHIEPAWIERQAAHLTRTTCRDPHWSRKRGAVVAYEQVTLFGLVLVERRAVTFLKQDPALAQQVFFSEALARCDIDARADFLHANARVLGEACDIEARQRRQGLLKSDEDLAQFFTGKLPPDIASSRALDAWYRKAAPSAQAALRWSLGDVLDRPAGLDAGAFPAELELDGQRYRLNYRFVPGDAADGVSLQLPLALLNALPEVRCEWLVPGLLADKVAELIRRLPKALRRNFVPAPDFARAFVEAEAGASAEQPLAAALARFLTRTTGVVIGADAFADAALPAHLLMRFELRDEHGKVLAGSRDLDALRAQWAGQARAAFARTSDVDLPRDNRQAWDFDDIPTRIATAGKPDAFPALVDQGASVALRVFERNAEARTEHARGVRRLLRLALESDLRRARRQLPLPKAMALKHAPLGTLEGLREDLVAGGFADVLGGQDLHVRTRAAFDVLRDAVAHQLFAAAVERLKLAEPIIDAQAALKEWLRPARPGQSPASYADLAEQFDALLTPGFLRELQAARLAHFPRYLKAMQVRAERLRLDPGKDHQRLQQVLPYWREYVRLRADAVDCDALPRLRWLIEEWRVSLFAQQLKTAEPVSPKRLQLALAAIHEWPGH